MRRPVIIGLTGSIGMGKSTVARKFRALGVPVFDADAAVHRLQGPGGAALPAIEAAFPGSTGAHGIDRAALRSVILDDPSARKRLESIVHPQVGQLQRRFIQHNRSRRAVCLDVPLLLEGESWRRCDLIAVVSAPFHVQRARVLARPGMTEAQFRAILVLQMPDAVKRRLADIVIETGRGRLTTWRTVAAIVRVVNGRTALSAFA